MSVTSLTVENYLTFLPDFVSQLFIVPSFDAVNTSFDINFVDVIILLWAINDFIIEILSRLFIKFAVPSKVQTIKNSLSQEKLIAEAVVRLRLISLICLTD